MTPESRYNALLDRLESLGSVLVAYSGGIDSTLLAYSARKVLGDQCTVVLATSDTFPLSEAEQARSVAEALNLDLVEVQTFELANADFAANPPDRCYYCKTELFGLLTDVAKTGGFSYVVDGSNADDLGDFRPGRRAAAEFGVLSPLQDVGMTKLEIRAISRELGLPNWDKPSMACLASRFPYGETIAKPALDRIARAESALRELGVVQSRVRSHGDVARVEVAADEMEQAWALRTQISAALKEAGFSWVALDADGYRSGSMNEALTDEGLAE